MQNPEQAVQMEDLFPFQYTLQLSKQSHSKENFSRSSVCSVSLASLAGRKERDRASGPVMRGWYVFLPQMNNSRKERQASVCRTTRFYFFLAAEMIKREPAELSAWAGAEKLWEEPVPEGVRRGVSLVSGQVWTVSRVRTNSGRLRQWAETRNMRWTVNACCNGKTKPSSPLLPSVRCSLRSKKHPTNHTGPLLIISADPQQLLQINDKQLVMATKLVPLPLAEDPGGADTGCLSQHWFFNNCSIFFAFSSATWCRFLERGWISNTIFYKAPLIFCMSIFWRPKGSALPHLLHGHKHHFCRHTARNVQCLGEKHMVLLTEALLLSAGQITSAGYSI